MSLKTVIIQNIESITTTTITDDNATNATMYPAWVAANTGSIPVYVSSDKLTWNPSSGAFGLGGTLTATDHITAVNYIYVDGYFTNNNLKINGNEIHEVATDGTAEVAINYVGFDDGTSQYRNFHVYDGAHASVALFEGESGTVNFYYDFRATTATFSGTVTIQNDLQGNTATFSGTVTTQGDLQGNTATFSSNVTVQGALRGKRPSATTFSGTTGTLALGDAQYFQICNNASPQTITVPANGDVAFPINTEIDFFQQGAGQVIFEAAVGVTIQAYIGLKLAGQYAAATLKKIDTNTWVLIGNLVA